MADLLLSLCNKSGESVMIDVVVVALSMKCWKRRRGLHSSPQTGWSCAPLLFPQAIFVLDFLTYIVCT
jgi:hypothetical protein